MCYWQFKTRYLHKNIQKVQIHFQKIPYYITCKDNTFISYSPIYSNNNNNNNNNSNYSNTIDINESNNDEVVCKLRKLVP